LGFCSFWTIGKEGNEVTIFRLGLLERMFRVPRIGDGKLCDRNVTRIWIGVDEIDQEGSRRAKFVSLNPFGLAGTA